ncbi:hypothetical protein SCP_1400910 [Sparassis crispa]|uniref:Uncharacterized protein n=1 Tax=Sparassis crispa TaxID=139825 RepID=A0A401H2K9_9APHY|nr:hypothetical protein SCP_1400910 [Sparassis crispa]GBE88686.1 hypothetical protein SCP_1400910 [Sparassis crispa]
MQMLFLSWQVVHVAELRPAWTPLSECSPSPSGHKDNEFEEFNGFEEDRSDESAEAPEQQLVHPEDVDDEVLKHPAVRDLDLRVASH